MVEIKNLITKALVARKNAYAPYSEFLVGAALLCVDDQVFVGCNVENAAYGNTICAERVAVTTGVAAGALSPSLPIKKLVLVGWAKGGKADYCLPCGTCLQVLSEFADAKGDFEVISAKSETDYQVYKFRDLLPYGFKFSK